MSYSSNDSGPWWFYVLVLLVLIGISWAWSTAAPGWRAEALAAVKERGYEVTRLEPDPWACGKYRIGFKFYTADPYVHGVVCVAQTGSWYSEPPTVRLR